MSGWNRRASRRYARLMSDSVAPRSRPSTRTGPWLPPCRTTSSLVDDLRVDHVTLRAAGARRGLGRTGSARRRPGAAARLRARRLLPVERLGQLVLRLRELLHRPVHPVRCRWHSSRSSRPRWPTARPPCRPRPPCRRSPAASSRRRTRPGRRGSRLDLLAPLAVLLGVRLGVLHHPVDLVLAEAARRRDRDLLLLAGAMSLADTLTIPLASMSKVTSICGTPRGAGGMPTSWNRPSVRLSRRAAARPGARAPRRSSDCRPPSRTSRSCASESSCCAESASSSRRRASRCRATAASRRAGAGP
jgi:hypothetical protein